VGRECQSRRGWRWLLADLPARWPALLPGVKRLSSSLFAVGGTDSVQMGSNERQKTVE
jgi:hypothetical protein